jgi:hypothetical protein
MKQRIGMIACVALTLAAGANAQSIRKCVDHGVVGYQTMPCGVGQVDAGLVKLPDYADPPQHDGATAPAQDAYGGTPAGEDVVTPVPATSPPPSQAAFPFRTSIALGMTDDQVLNMPQWGRPTHIERTGRHRGWRETWTYPRPTELRTLTFVEGRLANIDVDTPVTQIASLGR